MEFIYSSVIDKTTYQTDGLCDGIDVRIHDHNAFEDRGAIRAHEEWNKNVDSNNKKYRGTLGPQWSFMSVCVPECIPDRLEIISFANEFAFMYDDATENIPYEQTETENNTMMKAFIEGAKNGSISDLLPTMGGIAKIQSQMLHEMLTIDRECALTTMAAWARFVEVGSSRCHSTVFTSLDQYIPYRIHDVGEMFWYGVVTFGMGLKIPKEEMEQCRELTKAAWIAVSLTNDLFSWPKEREATIQNGRDHVVNAIWVIMHERGVSEDDARKVCTSLIREYVAEYVETVKTVQKDENLSLDLRKYVEAMQYSISGNVVWSRSCPRYHPEYSFNQTQLKWMECGVPEKERNFVLREDSPLRIDDATNSSVSCISQRVDYSLRAPIFDREERAFSSKISLEPYEYICSLGSKGFRDNYIDALNHWLKAPEAAVIKVKEVAKLLHNSSLLLDDIQDSSSLRRGKPAAHAIFGSAQTINSSSFCIVAAIACVQKSFSSLCASVVIEKLLRLFDGQSYDLFWTYNLHCPTMQEYVTMVDQKTGALFELLSCLLAGCTSQEASVNFRDLSTLLGRAFQIRDDYQNLTSAEYTDKKGYCEDFDEGKYSLPLIHLLHKEPDNPIVRNILSTRRGQGHLNRRQKLLVLEQMERTGSLEYTSAVLRELHAEIGREIGVIEDKLGVVNVHMRALWESMRL